MATINGPSLDRWITGNYGEDQYKESEPEREARCPSCGRVGDASLMTWLEVQGREVCLSCYEDWTNERCECCGADTRELPPGKHWRCANCCHEDAVREDRCRAIRKGTVR